MEVIDLELTLLNKLREIIPEATSCYHHLFGSEQGGWIIHDKYSKPISDKFSSKIAALEDAINSLDNI